MISSSTFWEQVSTGYSDLTTLALSSMIDSFGTFEAYVTIPLEILSSAFKIA